MKRSMSTIDLSDCVVRDTIRRMKEHDETHVDVDLQLQSRLDLLDITEAIPDNDHIRSLTVSLAHHTMSTIRRNTRDETNGGQERYCVLTGYNNRSQGRQDDTIAPNDMKEFGRVVAGLSNLTTLVWNETGCPNGLESFLDGLDPRSVNATFDSLEVRSPRMSLASAKRLAAFISTTNNLRRLSLHSLPDARLATVLQGVLMSKTIGSLHVTGVNAKDEDATIYLAAVIAKNRIHELTFLLQKDISAISAVSKIRPCQRALHHNTSIRKLDSDCLWQDVRGIQSSFCASVESLSLTDFPTRAKPSSVLMSSPNLRELVLEGSNVSVHSLSKVSSLLSLTTAPIRRFVLRRAWLAQDLRNENLACNRIYNFLISLVMLPHLEHLTIGSVGDDFLCCLAAIIDKFPKLKSLTVFVYRAHTVEPLTRRLRAVPTSLLEINIWPSNPLRRLLPPVSQLHELQQCLFVNRVRHIQAEQLLRMDDKTDDHENTTEDVSHGDIVAKKDIASMPLALWPHVLSKLGRLPTHDRNGNPTNDLHWHDVSYFLLSGRPDIMKT